MEFLETSDCTDESREDETYVYNLRWRKIISKLEKSLLYNMYIFFFDGEVSHGEKSGHKLHNINFKKI